MKFPGLVFHGQTAIPTENDSHRGPLTQVRIDERAPRQHSEKKESDGGEEMEGKGKAESGP